MRVTYHDPNIRDLNRPGGSARRQWHSKPRSVLTLVVTCIGLFASGAAQSSEFLRLCHASMAKAEAFLAECRTNARPFKRDFYPGGRGDPVPEEFCKKNANPGRTSDQLLDRHTKAGRYADA
jgi:hypothetical protein